MRIQKHRGHRWHLHPCIVLCFPADKRTMRKWQKKSFKHFVGMCYVTLSFQKKRSPESNNNRYKTHVIHFSIHEVRLGLQDWIHSFLTIRISTHPNPPCLKEAHLEVESQIKSNSCMFEGRNIQEVSLHWKGEQPGNLLSACCNYQDLVKPCYIISQQKWPPTQSTPQSNDQFVNIKISQIDKSHILLLISIPTCVRSPRSLNPFLPRLATASDSPLRRSCGCQLFW